MGGCLWGRGDGGGEEGEELLLFYVGEAKVMHCIIDDGGVEEGREEGDGGGGGRKRVSEEVVGPEGGDVGEEGLGEGLVLVSGVSHKEFVCAGACECGVCVSFAEVEGGEVVDRRKVKVHWGWLGYFFYGGGVLEDLGEGNGVVEVGDGKGGVDIFYFAVHNFRVFHVFCLFGRCFEERCCD